MQSGEVANMHEAHLTVVQILKKAMYMHYTLMYMIVPVVVLDHSPGLSGRHDLATVLAPNICGSITRV
jgi:hypothetical protein